MSLTRSRGRFNVPIVSAHSPNKLPKGKWVLVSMARGEPMRVSDISRRLILLIGAVLLVAGGLAGSAVAGGFSAASAAPAPATAAQNAASVRPCDIYAAGRTPCVAAYSTVRALYRAYQGPLYQVRRVSDG